MFKHISGLHTEKESMKDLLSDLSVAVEIREITRQPTCSSPPSIPWQSPSAAGWVMELARLTATQVDQPNYSGQLTASRLGIPKYLSSSLICRRNLAVFTHKANTRFWFIWPVIGNSAVSCGIYISSAKDPSHLFFEVKYFAGPHFHVYLSILKKYFSQYVSFYILCSLCITWSDNCIEKANARQKIIATFVCNL